MKHQWEFSTNEPDRFLLLHFNNFRGDENFIQRIAEPDMLLMCIARNIMLQSTMTWQVFLGTSVVKWNKSLVSNNREQNNSINGVYDAIRCLHICLYNGWVFYGNGCQPIISVSMTWNQLITAIDLLFPLTIMVFRYPSCVLSLPVVSNLSRLNAPRTIWELKTNFKLSVSENSSSNTCGSKVLKATLVGAKSVYDPFPITQTVNCN